jgi:predicted nucleic-acid-binding protein
VSFGVDTSVLVRLLVGEPAAAASRAKERLLDPEPGSGVLAVLQSKLSGKAGFVDRLIHARCEVDGLTTLTLDRAQAKLGRVELIR